jgi:hypothetical protein
VTKRAFFVGACNQDFYFVKFFQTGCVMNQEIESKISWESFFITWLPVTC